MPRSTNAPASRKRRKKILKRAKGFFSGRRKLIRTANETVMRAMAFATRDRKQRKRQYRRLWTARINAACRSNGVSYSRFIEGLSKAKINLNRKVLADIAIQDPTTFRELVELVAASKKKK